MTIHRCDSCSHEIDMGSTSLPRIRDWVKISCPECGEVMDISLVRHYQLQELNKEKKAQETQSSSSSS